MWVLVCTVLGLLAPTLGISPRTSADVVYKAEFDNFIAQYRREYESVEEYSKRLAIFSANMVLADKLDMADPNARYGVTKFMDLSPEEFRRYYLISNFTSPKTKGVSPLPLLPFNNTGETIYTLPDEFDWRSKGVVTAVYNQGRCGSCWAFSTTENIESMWARAGHGLENLSMQQLVDCDRQSNGCSGGNPPNAFQYVINVGGIDTYSSYPYAGVNQYCRANGGIGAKVRQWGYLSTNDNEQAMLSWVANYGPPSACVDAQYWQFYRGGVITTNCGSQIDHCIQITGWTIVNGISAWTVRNSWGTDWGESGYLYVRYGGNVCAIGSESQACFTY